MPWALYRKQNSLYNQVNKNAPKNCPLLTYSYRKKRNFGDLCFISWLIGSMYFVQFSEITTSECHFTEKAACQNAVSTTESKTVKWKQDAIKESTLNAIDNGSIL